jgi:antitoxin component YwqK of YwqJK toxin-antitoxin module
MRCNKSLAVWLVLILSASVVAATPTDRERGDLKGSVKSVRTESAAYSGPAGTCSENKREIESVSEYNLDGNLAQFTYYNFEGGIQQRNVFSYDASGIRLSQLSYDAAGVAFSKQLFDPSNAGRPTVSYMRQTSAVIFDQTTTWQYNDNGQPVGTATRDSKGNLIWSRILDSAGRPTEEDEYKDGALFSKEVVSYDSNGNRLESTQYNADGSLLDGPKHPARYVYTYNSAGLLMEQTQTDASGSVVWKLTYAYDDHQNMTEHSTYRQGTTLISHRTFAYRYDSTGNWTRQTVSEDFTNTCSHPMQVRYRTITYY